MPLTSPLNVFISSTCYDLIDLRAELGQFLQSHGLAFRLSEDPFSGFCVEPTADSIESCLANVRDSDVLVCIVDRRYGPPLPKRYGGKSATELEVQHAYSLKPPKPMFFFLREAAYDDYQRLKVDPSAETIWVERHNREQARLWYEFVQHANSLPEHANRSNWCDRFRTVADLKPLVLKRLTDKFAVRSIGLALQPDRFVRLHFVEVPVSGETALYVRGYFENVGVGPALNLACGFTALLPSSLDPGYSYADAPEGSIVTRGGLAEGHRVTDINSESRRFRAGDEALSGTMFCIYENRFRDKYLVESPLSRENKNRNFQRVGHDRLFVASRGGYEPAKWIEVK